MSTVVILVEIHFPLLLGGVGLVYIQGQVGGWLLLGVTGICKVGFRPFQIALAHRWPPFVAAGDRPGGGWCQYRPFFALRPTAVVPTPTA